MGYLNYRAKIVGITFILFTLLYFLVHKEKNFFQFTWYKKKCWCDHFCSEFFEIFEYENCKYVLLRRHYRKQFELSIFKIDIQIHIKNYY